MITRRRVLRIILIVALAIATLNLLRTLRAPSSPALPQPHRQVVELPADRELDGFAVAPDGKTIAYTLVRPSGEFDLILHRLDGSAPQAVAKSGSHAFFSPDGQWLAFFESGSLWKAPIAAPGDRTKVCGASGENAGGTWTDDGRIVFAPLGGQGLMTVPAAGGGPVPLTTLSRRDLELAHGWPHALPGGGIVFTVSQRGRDPHLELLSASNARSGRLLPAIGPAQYESTGHLVYSYLGDLYTVAFDARAMKVQGAPLAVARGVQTSTGYDQLGDAAFSLSRNGTLAWVRSTPRDLDRELVTLSLNDGAASSIKAPAAPYETPRWSADGRQLAVAVRSAVMTRDIRVMDISGRLLFALQGGDNLSPAWMPDGRLSFASNRGGLQKIYVAARDGRSVAPLFSTDVQVARNPSSWLKEPPLLAFYEIDPFRSRDVLVYHVDEAIVPVAATLANERSPALSPDGRSVAYVSDSSGRDEIYLAALNGKDDPRRISQNGGIEPVWTHEALIYRHEDDLLRADGTKILAGRRFAKDPGANAAAYDIDSSRKLIVVLMQARKVRELRIVANWGTELTLQRPVK